jgi:hypothetical protein
VNEMGQYLQMGIVLKKWIWILFDLREDEKYIRFEIKESIVQEQLYEFLKYQFTLYEKSDVEGFESTLKAISEKHSLQEIVAMADENSFRYLQSSKIYDEIQVSSWDWLRIEVSMLVFFVEGKIFMEGYGQFLRYLENVIRASSGRWPIAGAFRAFID